jgi:hypothetical protein
MESIGWESKKGVRASQTERLVVVVWLVSCFSLLPLQRSTEITRNGANKLFRLVSGEDAIASCNRLESCEPSKMLHLARLAGKLRLRPRGNRRLTRRIWGQVRRLRSLRSVKPPALPGSLARRIRPRRLCHWGCAGSTTSETLGSLHDQNRGPVVPYN